MKGYILAAALGSAMLLTVPAFAVTTPYIFNFTAGASGTGNDQLSSFTATNTGTLMNVTAKAIGSYYTVGAPSPGTGVGLLHSGLLGQYGTAGLGACESTTGVDCTQPNHQIDNGPNSSTGTGTNQYEFILIQFSSAVDLASIQLGNYGDNNTSTDPFSMTYFTSASAATTLNLNNVTFGTSGFTSTSLGDGFSGPMSQSSQTGIGSGCVVNGQCLGRHRCDGHQ